MILRRAFILFSRKVGKISFSPLISKQCFPSRGLVTLPKKEDRLRAAVLLAGPVITFCLGCWQVKRLFWKQDLIEKLQQSMTQEPLRFDVVREEEDINDIFQRLPEYQRVKFCGRFDHNREIYIRPRPRIENGKPHARSGAYVITPFILSSPIYPKNIRGNWILVNRGWVDFAHVDPKTRSDGQIVDDVEIVGVVRKSERRLSPFLLKNIKDEKNVLWSQRNVEEMSQVLGTVPLYIDADASTTVPGGPLGGQTILSVRNQHLSYIITWWGLSAGGAYIWFRTFIKP